VHPAVGRQREDLDQRLGLAQPPRAIGEDVVADGDRETAQQADARLGAVARGSPLPDEPNAGTRGRRARRRSRLVGVVGEQGDLDAVVDVELVDPDRDGDLALAFGEAVELLAGGDGCGRWSAAISSAAASTSARAIPRALAHRGTQFFKRSAKRCR
jgi:hypothetical protein